ncbi:MAG: sulfotransferase [Rhodothermales bacterium]|nr:sulfotransferase [Rhodothermales bacterium]
MSATPTPFFIVGASRSGTTMLRLLLNAHSRIGVPKELAFFTQAMQKGALTASARGRLTAATQRDFLHAFLTKKHHIFTRVDVAALEASILKAHPTDLRAALDSVMAAWLTEQGKERWGEKTPKNLFYVDYIHALYPEARFIHIVRDPRAVVYSMNRFARFLNDSVLNAFNWYLSVKDGYGLLKRAVPASLVMTIRYEDLVAGVEDTARRMCEFLGESFEPAMLDFYRESETNIHPASAELGGVNTLTQPISTASVDKWRGGLATSEIALVEAVCGPLMEEMGYTLTGERLAGSAHLSLQARLAYCQVQRWRHRRMRAYQIASMPFERSRGTVKKWVGDEDE